MHGDFVFCIGKSVPSIADAMIILGPSIISVNLKCVKHGTGKDAMETQIARVLHSDGTPVKNKDGDCYAVIIRDVFRSGKATNERLVWYPIKRYERYFSNN